MTQSTEAFAVCFFGEADHALAFDEEVLHILILPQLIKSAIQRLIFQLDLEHVFVQLLLIPLHDHGCATPPLESINIRHAVLFNAVDEGHGHRHNRHIRRLFIRRMLLVSIIFQSVLV